MLGLISNPVQGNGMGDHREFDKDIIRLGPLAGLIGSWEGDNGTDLSPGVPDRLLTDKSAFRERWIFRPIAKAENHDQVLHGLSCTTTAWRLINGQAFHEQTGYWLWDAGDQQVLCTFVVPRGISIQAGATVKPDATSFDLLAETGSETYGICQNPFLHEHFKIVRYQIRLILHGDDSFDYEQDTQMQIKGRPNLFHHTDANHLRRQANMPSR